MPKYRGVQKKGNLWYWYIDYQRKRIYSRGFNTAEEASQDRAQAESRLKTGTYISTHKITFDQFFEQYLEEHAHVNMRPTTVYCLEGRVRNHVLPRIGDMKLQDLKPYHIEKLKNILARETSPFVTFNTMCDVRKILNKAVRWDMIYINPLSRIDFPKKPKTEHSILPPAELFDLIDGLEGYPKYVVAIAGFTGMRRSEIFGLQWEDINFDDGTITLERQWHHGAARPLKTDISRGTIPVCPTLIRMLKEWKLRSGSPKWVFPSHPNAKPLSPEGFTSKVWPEIRKEFNLPADFRFHDLRHTFASILLALGERMENVQNLMRHSNYSTTMNVYRHLLPNQLETALKSLDALYMEKNVEKAR